VAAQRFDKRRYVFDDHQALTLTLHRHQYSAQAPSRSGVASQLCGFSLSRVIGVEGVGKKNSDASENQKRNKERHVKAPDSGWGTLHTVVFPCVKFKAVKLRCWGWGQCDYEGRASIQESLHCRGAPQGFPSCEDVALALLANIELATLKILFAMPVDAGAFAPRA